MRGLGNAGNALPGDLGPLTPYRPPTIESLQSFQVNRGGQYEVVWNPLYDIQTYGTAGATQFTFFQTPVGQGGTTLADTNMRAPGQMPFPQQFLVCGIQVYWKGGTAIARAGLAAAVVQENINDVNDVLFGDSYLDFFIGSKSYLTDAPAGKFVQMFGQDPRGWMSGSTTVDINGRFIDYNRHVGRYYSITPVLLVANQNFNVTVNFPVAITVPVAATIGVILDGFNYRLSQ